MFKKLIIFLLAVFFLAVPLTAEDKKEDTEKAKVKTGVEVEKGDKAPEWDAQILKKKHEQKEKTKEEMKKEKKERKLEKNKERSEKRKKKGK